MGTSTQKRQLTLEARAHAEAMLVAMDAIENKWSMLDALIEAYKRGAESGHE